MKRKSKQNPCLLFSTKQSSNMCRISRTNVQFNKNSVTKSKPVLKEQKQNLQQSNPSEIIQQQKRQCIGLNQTMNNFQSLTPIKRVRESIINEYSGKQSQMCINRKKQQDLLILNMFKAISKPQAAKTKNIWSSYSIATDNSQFLKNYSNQIRKVDIFEQIEKQNQKKNQLKKKKSLSVLHSLCTQLVKRLDSEFKYDHQSNRIRKLCQSFLHTRHMNGFQIQQKNIKNKSQSLFVTPQSNKRSEQLSRDNKNLRSIEILKIKNQNCSYHDKIKVNQDIIGMCNQVQMQSYNKFKKKFKMFRKFDDNFKERCSRSKQFLEQFKRLT